MLRISPDDTPLRQLLAEEVVLLIESRGFSPKDLGQSDVTPGLSGKWVFVGCIPSVRRLWSALPSSKFEA